MRKLVHLVGFIIRNFQMLVSPIRMGKPQLICWHVYLFYNDALRMASRCRIVYVLTHDMNVVSLSACVG
jgi:hypothetical protein